MRSDFPDLLTVTVLLSAFAHRRVQGVALFEFVGNKIKRQYDDYDVFTLRNQTGMTNPQ